MHSRRAVAVMFPVIFSMNTKVAVRAFLRGAAYSTPRMRLQNRNFGAVSLGFQPKDLVKISSGAEGTLSHAVHINKDGKPISPWHDIELNNGEYFNFICEVNQSIYRK